MTKTDRRPPLSWGEVVGFGLLFVVVVLMVRSGARSSGGELVPAGTPLPKFMAEGWLNRDETLTRESLRGKVVVVDCWATWCPPCRRAMPELAKLYEKYNPLGVEFLGLTSESEQDLSAIKSFVEKTKGFDWPVAYGTMPMQDLLGIQVLPTVIVFGADGTAVWSDSQLYGIEDAIDQELAKSAS